MLVHVDQNQSWKLFVIDFEGAKKLTAEEWKIRPPLNAAWKTLSPEQQDVYGVDYDSDILDIPEDTPNM